ncbi:MAG TPA: flagellin [Caulobacteraceae bacterium]|jgi:flagellin|nr:flagellin [Caulobacteraceae bacterium]
MSLNSVNTNTGAMIALQNLNSTNSQINNVQNEISTGLKVASPQDDGATWSIAQSQRAQVMSLDAVNDSLNRGLSATDVAMTAGQTVSDLLLQMKQKALAASDTSLDATSRAALNSDFQSLRDQITQVVTNADFNGTNLISSGAKNYNALANANGTSTITVLAEDLSIGGANVGLSATATIGTVTLAQGMVTTLDTSINSVSAALANLGTGANALQTQLTFTGKLQDTLNTGIGNLVDADLAKASAQLQALQTKQQLGVQSLSIANSSSTTLLSLFRNIS